MNKCNSISALFGQRVRDLRVSMQLSQEQLAALCGLDRTYISSVERGQRNVSLKNIAALAQALNVSLSEFFEDMAVDDKS